VETDTMVTVEATGVGMVIPIDSVQDVADRRVFAAGVDVVEEVAAEIGLPELALELLAKLELIVLNELESRAVDVL